MIQCLDYHYRMKLESIDRAKPLRSRDNNDCLPGWVLQVWSHREPCTELEEAGTDAAAPSQTSGWQFAACWHQQKGRCSHCCSSGACLHPLCALGWRRGRALAPALLTNQPVGCEWKFSQRAEKTDRRARNFLLQIQMGQFSPLIQIWLMMQTGHPQESQHKVKRCDKVKIIFF